MLGLDDETIKDNKTWTKVMKALQAQIRVKYFPQLRSKVIKQWPTLSVTKMYTNTRAKFDEPTVADPEL